MSKAQIAISAVDQTKAAFDSAKRNLQGLGEQASALPAKFGTLGLAIAGVFTAATIKGAVDMLDKLDDLSEKTGISVENLSTLRYAGEVTGTTLEAIATSVKKLSVNMVEAANGNKEAAATFKAVGVEVRNTDGSLRNQDAVLGDLADRFASYADGAGKSALAQKIFGKAGADMIPLLNQGSDGIARLRKEAEGLGLVYGGELAKQAAVFNDNLKKLELSAEAAKVQLAGGLLPTLNGLVETFVQLKSNGVFWLAIEQGLARVTKYVPLLSGMVTALRGLTGLGGQSLSGDAGADINRLMQDRARIEKSISFADSKGAPSRDLVREKARIENLLKLSRLYQAQDALQNGADSGDAMSRRMRAKPRRDAPAGGAGDDSAAKAANKELEAQAKLLAELSGLSGSFAEDWGRLNAIYAKGGISLKQLTEQQAILLAKQPAIKAQLELEERLGQSRVKTADLSDKYLSSMVAENEQLAKSNQSLLEEVEQIGLSAEVLNILRLARMDANLAREQELLLVAQGIEGNEAEAAQIERRINLLRRERDLKADGQVKEIRAAEAEDNKKRTEGISASISEGLLDGFRNGRSLSDIFLNELKAQFAKTVLQPLISPIVSAGNDALSGALKGVGGGIFNASLGSLVRGGRNSIAGSSNSSAADYVNSFDVMSDAANSGGMLNGVTGFLAKLFSFDGGGYTGSGARAGGLDGKGGFMAMMHPQETVLDHTKGQGTGGGNTVNNYYTQSFGAGVSRAEAYEGFRRARAEAVNDVAEGQRRRRF